MPLPDDDELPELPDAAPTLHATAPSDTTVQCYVKRTKFKSCLGALAGAKYELFLKMNDQLLASAEKGATDTSYMLYGTAGEVEVVGRGRSHKAANIGKLKINGNHTYFRLVDNGRFNAKKQGLWADDRDRFDAGKLEARQELAQISVGTSKEGGRTLRVQVPSSDAPLVTKEPEWNSQAKQKQLDFKGRVTLPSVKNFQLVSESADAPTPRGGVKMTFGRVGKDAFNLDYTAPLSAMQAFGIALSIFGAKR